MAMSGTGMGDEVVDAIIAASPGYGALGPTEQAKVRDFWRTICGAIVAHITTNAKLNFEPAEIMIDAGSFVSPVGPVTGQGINAAVALKGSIT